MHPPWLTPAHWAERGPHTADQQGLAPAWIALAPLKPLWARLGMSNAGRTPLGVCPGVVKAVGSMRTAGSLAKASGSVRRRREKINERPSKNY